MFSTGPFSHLCFVLSGPLPSPLRGEGGGLRVWLRALVRLQIEKGVEIVSDCSEMMLLIKRVCAAMERRRMSIRVQFSGLPEV
jgi:hypothetical protein